jgi:XTP/dITP diphosphohydrolase
VRASVLDGIPDELPALLWADKVAERLERAGAPVEAAASDDVGEQLLALVLRAQADGVDPEQALRRAVRARINQS